MYLQELIFRLQEYWARQGCVILQPYDLEVGAGTMHPATFLRALGPEPWNVAYVQPSRRPADGRFGENPNRLFQHHQLQVILKPSPKDVQQLYLESIRALGIDPLEHDVRFVEDDWESPTLGAWGLAPGGPPTGVLGQQLVAVGYLESDTLALDRVLVLIIPNAPAIQQAEAKLAQARRDLAQAELNLRYCDVFSEIDGQVTSRNINPGNNVQAGQSLMAVRALQPPDLWVDANFKETQLADLRIGQRVRLEVDMYGGRREFEGRISGFTMGTGQTLALLPPQNATGNFVKIVQS